MEEDVALPGGEQELDAVVDQYVAEVTRLSQGVFSTDADWAGERVSHMAWLGRYAEVWDVLLAAIDRIEEERVLCQLGAGELEGLIDAWPELIDDLERRAPENPHLVAALRCAWVTGGSVQERLAALLASAS